MNDLLSLVAVAEDGMPVSQEAIYAAFVAMSGAIVFMAGGFATIGKIIWNELAKERKAREEAEKLTLRWKHSYAELKRDFEQYKRDN